MPRPLLFAMLHAQQVACERLPAMQAPPPLCAQHLLLLQHAHWSASGPGMQGQLCAAARAWHLIAKLLQFLCGPDRVSTCMRPGCKQPLPHAAHLEGLDTSESRTRLLKPAGQLATVTASCSVATSGLLSDVRARCRSGLRDARRC